MGTIFIFAFFTDSFSSSEITASSGCPGGETASANCGKGVVVQGDANANGAAPDIGGRK